MTTKEKILESALLLFAEGGVDKTSTAAIAKQAEVASGTVFVHFQTKEELIKELYVSMKQKLLVELAEVLQTSSTEQTVEQTCKQLFSHIITHLLQNPKRFSFVQQVEHNPAHALCTEKETVCTDELGIFFFNAMQKKYIRTIDIELLQRMLWGFFEAIVLHYQQKEIQEVQREHIEIIYSAIKNKQ